MITWINKTIEASNGYKTKSAVLVFLLLQLFGDKIPLTPGQREITVNLVEFLMASGLIHDFWRHRESCLQWIKNLFTNNKTIL
jgi:hypothetical protein